MAGDLSRGAKELADKVDDGLADRVAAARARYEALSPVDKALHDADQRRSFVRGQSGRDPGPDVLADEVRRLRAEVTRLSAERDRLEKDCRRWHKAAMDAGVITLVNGALKFSQQERAERAETERDSECERAASLGRLYEAECARAINAESELSALKARVAEVLEPFAKINNDWMGFTRPDLPDDHELNIMGSTVGHFRKASNLHTTLTGEQK